MSTSEQPRKHGETDCEGESELTAVQTGLSTLFGNAMVAASLGLALGVGLLLFSRYSARFLTPDDPGFGMGRVLFAMVVRMAVVLGALVAYFLWARQALVPFGVALCAGFLACTGYELFRFSGLTKSRA